MRFFHARTPTTPFERAVHRAVRSVPRGRVTTYGDIALVVGKPRAARAVGNVLRQGPADLPTPYHRVVLSDGRVGGWGDGDPRAGRKVRRLRGEGVQVDGTGRVVGFARRRHAWPRPTIRS